MDRDPIPGAPTDRALETLRLRWSGAWVIGVMVRAPPPALIDDASTTGDLQRSLQAEGLGGERPFNTHVGTRTGSHALRAEPSEEDMYAHVTKHPNLSHDPVTTCPKIMEQNKYIEPHRAGICVRFAQPYMCEV